MIRFILAVASAACLAGCNTTAVAPPSVSFGGPPLVSGQTPPSPLARNSEPEPPNSLPPGAAGLGGGPIARAPDNGSVTVKLPY